MTNLYLSAVLIIGISLNSLSPETGNTDKPETYIACETVKCLQQDETRIPVKPNTTEPWLEAEIANTQF